ncbi:MCE family protein [Saccharomonospora viridis]|jgi:phospholipid/cholesterol/gamma-HCH transport system substrate-binding protein|uniref:Virulence factor Mce family protein n=2 Tax=Saccharomonospora viridis TaxID=1852 RepID=C7MTI1_SACVD|nr:MCE family protein [Saccharomonospora viridis]ACU95451.1 virulence factor Mce family protein [Saccharomonospora viridis DSM 43017]SFP13779.1 phospholipid/cholesterol/gamma-HCH transport system substrate-binding protein [Saccharomonospora viridis]
MTSFSNRNPIPIAIVGITLLFLGTLAALNSDDLPLIGGGTTYRAEFSEAAGLETDDEVRIAGVKVGEVTDIDLDGAKVLVSFKVSDAWIGDETTAAIKIKTLLGRKYLALDPSGDEPLDPNTTIPLERTTAPYDVLEAFRGLSRTVDDIDVNQLARSFDVLSRTFANTPEDVRGALEGLSELSDTIASRDQQLSELLEGTRRISQTLADRDAELAVLLEDGNELLEELSAREEAISAMLTGTRKLSEQLRGLVDDNEEQLQPVLEKLDQLTDMLQRNQESLAEGIENFAPFVRVFNNTIGSGRWFDSYICGLLLPSIGPLNEEGCNAR